jgi:two-component system phosphate regulon sensor histidine kinase PhoR
LEVEEVAGALEGARPDLQHSLSNLEREKAWVDHLLESIVEGIVTLDHQGQIGYFSAGAEQITGWSRDQVLGRSFDQVFQLVESEEPASGLIPVPGTKKKMIIRLSEDREAVLSFTGARIAPAEAGDTWIALVFRDISEEELIRRILGDFLANITHEFRTPLSAAAASAELLMDQLEDLSHAELRELLNSLHLGILGLQTLVDNLLESASIEAGRFYVSPRISDLSKIIAEAVKLIQPLLEKYSQQLIVELPVELPAVLADERRIIQVLVNLISNASKYGPSDAEIKVSASAANQWIQIQVADLGPGIPIEYQDQVFRRFMYPSKLTY